MVPDPTSMDPHVDVANLDAKLLAEESADRALLDELAALRVRQRKRGRQQHGWQLKQEGEGEQGEGKDLHRQGR